MIFVVVLEQRDAGGKLVSEDFVRRHTLGSEAVFTRAAAEKPISDRERLKAVIRYFEKWCPSCKGRGWHVGECHPQETCGICDGNGAVAAKEGQ